MAGWSSKYPKSLVTQSAWGYPAPKQTRIISHKILLNWNPSVYYHKVTLSLTWLTSRLFLTYKIPGLSLELTRITCVFLEGEAWSPWDSWKARDRQPLSLWLASLVLGKTTLHQPADSKLRSSPKAGGVTCTERTNSDMTRLASR